MLAVIGLLIVIVVVALLLSGRACPSWRWCWCR